MKDIEGLVQQRVRMLIFAVFAFGLWQFAWIAQDVLKEAGGIVYQMAGWLTVVGALSWVGASYWFYKYNKEVKEAQACLVLNDELTQRNRSQAFVFGYFMLFGMIWVLIPITDFWTFELKYAVRTVATLGILLPITYFIYLERKNAEVED